MNNWEEKWEAFIRNFRPQVKVEIEGLNYSEIHKQLQEEAQGILAIKSKAFIRSLLAQERQRVVEMIVRMVKKQDIKVTKRDEKGFATHAVSSRFSEKDDGYNQAFSDLKDRLQEQNITDKEL